MKKVVSFVLSFACLFALSFVFVACKDKTKKEEEPQKEHEHNYSSTVTGYDENGSYCKWQVCGECEEKGEKTVVVEGISQTNAVLAGTAIKENGSESANFVLGKSFDETISALAARSASDQNTSTLKTTLNGKDVNGLALSGNIKLTQDIVVGYNGNTTLGFNIIENTTIDLNGHTITQRCGTTGLSGYALFVVREGATLNIIDSSANHNGVINAVTIAIEIKNGAVANLYDGTVKCGAMMTASDVDPVDDPMAIWTIAFGSNGGGTYNQFGGKLEIVETRDIRGGGTYTHTKWLYAFSSYSNSGEKNVVNIYGGEFVNSINEAANLNHVIVNDLR